MIFPRAKDHVDRERRERGAVALLLVASGNREEGSGSRCLLPRGTEERDRDPATVRRVAFGGKFLWR